MARPRPTSCGAFVTRVPPAEVSVHFCVTTSYAASGRSSLGGHCKARKRSRLPSGKPAAWSSSWVAALGTLTGGRLLPRCRESKSSTNRWRIAD